MYINILSKQWLQDTTAIYSMYGIFRVYVVYRDVFSDFNQEYSIFQNKW